MRIHTWRELWGWCPRFLLLTGEWEPLLYWVWCCFNHVIYIYLYGWHRRQNPLYTSGSNFFLVVVSPNEQQHSSLRLDHSLWLCKRVFWLSDFPDITTCLGNFESSSTMSSTQWIFTHWTQHTPTSQRSRQDAWEPRYLKNTVFWDFKEGVLNLLCT